MRRNGVPASNKAVASPFPKIEAFVGPPLLNVDEGLGEIARLVRSNRGHSVVVGVGGGSCAGKTTVSSGLVERIPDSGILEMDAYYRSRPAVPERADFNFDEPGALDIELLKEHLRSLRSGGGIHKPVYDFSTHVRTGTEWFAPCRVVILDGLFALHRTFGEWVDFGVYVDCGEEVRRSRRVERDRTERGRTVSSVLHQYETTVRPMFEVHIKGTESRADVVVWNQ